MTTLTRTKPPTKHRRYPVGEHPIYDETFELKQKRSPILNSKARERDLRNSAALHDEAACRQTLLQLVGNPDKDNHYLQENTWKKALIPSAEKSLLKIKLEFNQWARNQVKNGFALKRPKKWPDNLLEKRLKVEAFLDIHRREKEVVEQTIKEHKKQAEKERRKKILEFGPKCIGIEPPPKKSGRKWLVDGQRINRTAEGIPYIDEPSSPYHEMPLVFYRQMSKKWQADYRQQVEEQWEEIEDGGMRNKETGKVITELAFTRLRRGRTVSISKDELPEWPEEAQKISELENNPT